MVEQESCRDCAHEPEPWEALDYCCTAGRLLVKDELWMQCVRLVDLFWHAPNIAAFV
jgi:hypothetical protein